MKELGKQVIPLVRRKDSFRQDLDTTWENMKREANAHTFIYLFLLVLNFEDEIL